MICYDFDGDGNSDCVTINMDGVVELYENYQVNGFMEVGKPLEAMYTGKLSLMDANNNGTWELQEC